MESGRTILSFPCIKYDTCRQAVVISQQQSPSTMLCLNKWEIMICHKRELLGRFTCREYDVKYNRRILRIVFHGLNALLKRNSLGIAFYHLGRISNFVSFLLYFWVYSSSPPFLNISFPCIPFFLIPPFLLSFFFFFTFFIELSMSGVDKLWPWVEAGLPPASVDEILESNEAHLFSYCL